MTGAWTVARSLSVAVLLTLLCPQVSSAKIKAEEEDCTLKCEPSKCPNVGPIGLSQCPAPYIKVYNCGCCKKCDMVPITTTISPSRRDEVCKEVKCPKKKVCVLNIQGLPVCKCPTEELCKKYAPMGGGAKKLKVCGSDGITYPSRCHLKVASCNSGEKKVRVLHRGDCGRNLDDISTRKPTQNLPTGQKSRKPNIEDDIRANTPRSQKNSKRKNRKEKQRKNNRQGKKQEKSYQRSFKRLH